MSDSHHSIPYNTAISFILQFITKYSSAASQSLGGFIDRATIETILANNAENDLYGLLLWHCYDDTLSFPYFFPAFTNMDGFDVNNPPSSVSSSSTADFYRARTIHRWTGPASVLAVRNYLENTDYSTARNANSITAADVSPLVTNYMNNFPPADDSNDYRDIACGLFIQEDTGITDLIKEPSCTGINYYFGITNDENPKICVVLFPVDNTGFNATDRLVFEHAYP